MNDNGSPPSKRMRLSGEELSRISKDEVIDLYMKQQVIIENLRAKHNGDKDGNDKCKTQLAETGRRENVLVMRLATKEQEIQQYAAQISHIKKSQEDAAAKSLRLAMLDPAVNLMFTKMKDELKETKDKLEQAQSELSAWKFTPDSQTGKKLMSRCRTLIAENQELGRQLSQGKVAQLEAELALQKKYSEELKESQEELNEFVIQLDEEVEGMQSTIQLLQQQLIDSRKDVEKYKKMAEDTDYDRNVRTKRHSNEIRTKEERQVSPEKEMGDMDSIHVKKEVGDDPMFEPNSGEGSPNENERNFENSEFICKEECDSEDGDNIGGENPSAMEVDEREYVGEVGDKIDKEGENTPTYSEHEVIDESRDSTPERTPEREYSDNGEGGSANGDQGYSDPHSVGSNVQDESPINEETYEILDNGSDDETEHVAHILSTANENIAVAEIVNKSAKHEVVAENIQVQDGRKETPSSIDNTFTLEEKSSYINGKICDSPIEVEETAIAIEDTKIRTEGGEYTQDIAAPQNEFTNAPSESLTPAPEIIQDSPKQEEMKEVSATISTPTVDENTTLITPSVQEADKTNLQAANKSANGEHGVNPPVAHPIMPQMPVMSATDPAAYLMNPHFQQMPSTTLAQQQAFMAEQASLMYKTLLAQQQHQLSMVDEKNAQLPDGSGVARTGDEIRAINTLVHGLPYADPSAAFLAQYKAMLAAQQLLMPGPDGKMIGPGGLGLYPGLPLVQPTMLAPQPSTDPVSNGVTTSWATNTNVTYTPHPLISQGLFRTSPAGLMMYPGPNLTPHSMPPVIEGDKHHGSGDHGPLQNGLPEQKPAETTETNVKEEPNVAV